MAEDLHIDLVDEKNKSSNTAPWVFLAEVALDDTESIRFAGYTSNITWGRVGFPTNVYYAAPIRLSTFTTNTQGNHSPFTVTIADVDGRVAAYIKSYDGLRGHRCEFHIVHSTNLTVGYAWRQVSEVLSARVTTAGTAFSIDQLNIFSRQGPRGTYRRGRCINEFGGRRGREGRCGFDTALPGAPQTCTRRLKGLNGCMEKAQYEIDNGLVQRHPGAFMGFPGIVLPRP